LLLYDLDKIANNLTCGCGPRKNSGESVPVACLFTIFDALSALKEAALKYSAPKRRGKDAAFAEHFLSFFISTLPLPSDGLGEVR
jgi:hypothetical protein